MAKILIEIDDDLKQAFTIWLAENKTTQKEVLTDCIRKIVESEEK